MDESFASLIGDYVEETLPLASETAELLLHLESAWNDREAGAEDVRLLKSALHTIKGNSAMMGFGPVRDVAHRLEDVLAHTGRPSARTSATMNVLIEGADLVTDLVRWVRFEKSAIEGPAAEDMLSRTRLFSERAQRHAEALASLSADEQPSPAEAEVSDGVQDARAPGEEVETSVRVPFERLDHLLELSSELVTSHASIVQLAHELAVDSGSHEHAWRLDEQATNLGRHVKALQSRLLALRMLPVSSLFGRYARFVRELSRERGQQIALETTGGDVPIDKTIIERLGEPLTHLINNAVAHGIEPPAEREARGKSAAATVRLDAQIEADHVLLTVSDDGRGLDIERITARGRAMGLRVDAMTDAEKRRLIFAPGFSTQTEVTSLAGRGVGLDVVENKLRTLGGHVELDSAAGQGTSFSIHLPLTLSTMRGLLVRMGQQGYIMPLLSVIETVRLEERDIHRIEGRGSFPWRGRMVSVSEANDLRIPGDAVEETSRPVCLIVGTERRARGLLVDEVLGVQDIVVKALDPVAQAPSFVTGATLLGDGRALLIVDPMRVSRSEAHSR